MRLLASFALLLPLPFAAAPASAASAERRAGVTTEPVEYRHGERTHKGVIAWSDAGGAKRPGVVVFPEWWGCNAYAKRRAEQLAELGYVALAADPYGEGLVTADAAEAGRRAGAVRNDPEAWAGMALAALEALRKHPRVDASRCAAMGYCFGGSTSLLLAARNADLRGVVSFHGSFPNAALEGAEAIRPKILVCHGGADGFVSEEERAKFLEILKKRKADYTFVEYAGASHSFTNPDAGMAGIASLSHHPSADARSWAHMRSFFAEIFGEGAGAAGPR